MKQSKAAKDWDLVIIGSGSAAFAAAIEAKSYGAQVLMIEEKKIGGTCVNVGCIPSKALLSVSNFFSKLNKNSFDEITITKGSLNSHQLKGNKDKIVKALKEKKYLNVAQAYGFEILQGTASFKNSETLSVNGKELVAQNYLIATGATAVVPSIKGIDTVKYLTYETALELEDIPESIAIIGGNAIGLEFAQHFANLGSKVYLIEALNRIAPFEEPEISQALTSNLNLRSVEVITNARILEIKKSQKDAIKVITIVNGKEREVIASKLLIATGRRPNTERLNLFNTAVKVGSKNEVVSDEFQRTTQQNIWAAGDVTGSFQYVYVAAAQGRVAANNAITGSFETLEYKAVPRVIFTSPPIGSVGLTEEKAKQMGFDPVAKILNFADVARAVVNRDDVGFIKMVAERQTGQILGLHIFGNSAEEILQAGVYIIQSGFTIEQLASSWSVYLSYSEALKLVAQSFEKDVSMMSCCAG